MPTPYEVYIQFPDKVSHVLENIWLETRPFLQSEVEDTNRLY
jgi:hypothetical protein